MTYHDPDDYLNYDRDEQLARILAKQDEQLDILRDLRPETPTPSISMPERLDVLERKATKAVTNTYGPAIQSDEQRFWIQKGIEGMRYAVATEGEE